MVFLLAWSLKGEMIANELFLCLEYAFNKDVRPTRVIQSVTERILRSTTGEEEGAKKKTMSI